MASCSSLLGSHARVHWQHARCRPGERTCKRTEEAPARSSQKRGEEKVVIEVKLPDGTLASAKIRHSRRFAEGSSVQLPADVLKKLGLVPFEKGGMTYVDLMIADESSSLAGKV